MNFRFLLSLQNSPPLSLLHHSLIWKTIDEAEEEMTERVISEEKLVVNYWNLKEFPLAANYEVGIVT